MILEDLARSKEAYAHGISGLQGAKFPCLPPARRRKPKTLKFAALDPK
jgi:hypothetical protein